MGDDRGDGECEELEGSQPRPRQGLPGNDGRQGGRGDDHEDPFPEVDPAGCAEDGTDGGPQHGHPQASRVMVPASARPAVGPSAPRWYSRRITRAGRRRDGADHLDDDERGGDLAVLRVAEQPRGEGQDEQDAEPLQGRPDEIDDRVRAERPRRSAPRRRCRHPVALPSHMPNLSTLMASGGSTPPK